MLDFNELVENHLRRERRPKVVGNYYPSEIGSCIRKVWYSYKFPVETPMDKLKIFEVGNIMHHFMADVLNSEKNPHIKLLESEMPFKIEMNGFKVSGRIDDLLLVKENNEEFLVEVKTTKNIDMSYEPQPHHVMQLQLYMHALKIKKGALVYVEKNNLRCKTFFVEYDENIAADALNRFFILHRHLTAETLPEAESRIHPERSWECRNCEFRERCFRDTPESQLRNSSAGTGIGGRASPA